MVITPRIKMRLRNPTQRPPLQLWVCSNNSFHYHIKAISFRPETACMVTTWMSRGMTCLHMRIGTFALIALLFQQTSLPSSFLHLISIHISTLSTLPLRILSSFHACIINDCGLDCCFWTKMIICNEASSFLNLHYVCICICVCMYIHTYTYI